MAHLLGSEYCLKSLSSDTRDLNGIVQDLIGRVGSVPVMSWKFPDKKACDLDFGYLLQQYTYCSDEPEANQVSHIVLLELIIDRYNLLLQILSKFILNHLPAEESQSSGQTHVSNGLGLVAKKFWNRMGQMSLLVRQLSDDARMSQMREGQYSPQQQQQQQQQEQQPPQKAPVASAPVTQAAAHVKLAKASQTVETAFVPCESCAEVQSGFNQLSSILTALCERERLPSALRIYRSQLAATTGGADWLSAGDLVRWRSELEKDTGKLAKHFTGVADANAELKQKNADLSQTIDRLKSRIDRFDEEARKEAERWAQQKRQLEAKAASLAESHAKVVEQMRAANQSLEETKRQLLAEIDAAKKSIAEQERLIILLGKIKEQLRRVTHRDDLSVEDLEQAVGTVGERLTDLTDQLAKAQEEVEATATKCDNLSRQNQSLHSKHRMTADRVAELTAENEQLKETIDELEEFKDNHRFSDKDLEKQLVSAQMQIKESELLIKTLSEAQENLTVSVQRLKAQVADLQESLQKSEDEKRVLVEFPDLNGPVNSDLQGTGDPMQDMQKQVEANETRIRLLTDQTAGMRRALEKIRLTSASGRAAAIAADSAVHLPPISSGSSGRPPPGPARQHAWQPHQQQQHHQQHRQHGEEEEAESDETSGRQEHRERPRHLREASDESRSDSDSSSQQAPFGARQSARRISDPVPLWQLQQQVQAADTATHTSGGGGTRRSGRPNSAATLASRPSSASRAAAASGSGSSNNNNSNSASIQVYKRAKAAAAGQPPAVLSWSASPHKEIVYPCSRCNKPFKLKSDLAMHKNYCSGKT